MATQGKVASRYAKALLDQFKGSKDADSVLAELEKFSAVIDGHAELTLLISSPGFSEEDKTAVVLAVAEKLKLSKPTVEVISGISKMGRLNALTAILERFRVSLRESEGVQPIQVWTAEAVSADDKKHIENKFEKLLGKKVEATYESSPGLVGGLKVVAGGRTYDGTVSGWLATLQDSLVEGEA